VTVCEIRDGIVVEIQGPLQQQSHWLRHKFYEEPMLRYIRQTYHGGTFIDGGACIGNHTLWFARYCTDRVIAIEPVARNMKHAQMNVELSGLQNRVLFIQAALGDKPGRGAMEHAGKYHGQYNLIDGDDVDIITLDSLIPLIEYPVTVIKLDIQWSEVQALHGALAMLEGYKPALFLELMSKVEIDGAMAVLKPFGYVMKQRFNKSPTYEFVSK